MTLEGRQWSDFFFFNDELDWFLDLQYGQSRKIRSLEATQGGVMLTWFRMMAVEELETGFLGCIMTRCLRSARPQLQQNMPPWVLAFFLLMDST